MKKMIPTLFGFFLLSVFPLAAQPAVDISDPEVIREVASRFGPGPASSFLAENVMVTSASPHATLAGLEILRRGGNAVDAAVAVQFALMVAEPYGSGLGGGFFAVGFNQASGEVYALDAREEAPEGFTEDRLRQASGRVIPFRRRITGGNAVGVPGTLDGSVRLLETFGTLTLEEVLRPAIRLARGGVPVTATFAANLEQHWDRLVQFPESARLFSSPVGGPLRMGDLHVNPDLADTLEALGRHGADYFYRGPLSVEMVVAVRGDSIQPGLMGLSDLANYRAVFREPVKSSFKGYTVFGMPMPSSGGVTVALMLNLFEASGSGDLLPGTPEFVRRMIDIQNVAFADRNRFMGDADFVRLPQEGLLDPEYAARRALLFTGAQFPVPAPPGEPVGWIEAEAANRALSGEEQTTHFTVVDADRNIISFTGTIEQHFGSGITVPGRGFLLNNQLTDFDVSPASAGESLAPNRPESRRALRRTALRGDENTLGGKRPRSSMSPTLVFKGETPVLALGSPGGSRIIGTVFQAVLYILQYGMDVQEAVNFPRVMSRNGPAELESPLFRNEKLLQALRDKGVEPVDGRAFGAVQAVRIRQDGWLEGAADPRREGSALGY